MKARQSKTPPGNGVCQNSSGCRCYNFYTTEISPESQARLDRIDAAIQSFFERQKAGRS